MKNNTSSGIDEFTVEFFKKFWSNLNVYICSTINCIFSKKRKIFPLRKSLELYPVYPREISQDNS